MIWSAMQMQSVELSERDLRITEEQKEILKKVMEMPMLSITKIEIDSHDFSFSMPVSKITRKIFKLDVYVVKIAMEEKMTYEEQVNDFVRCTQ